MGLRLRHPLQLGLFQSPVLDPELLALGDRVVRRDRLGPAHHVDRVDVELARDPRGLLIRTEAEHADAGHQHDERVGAADRRAVCRGVELVIGGVVGAVLLVQLLQAGDGCLDRGVRRQIQQHRLDLRSQEVVGAAGPQCRQFRGVRGCQKVEHDIRIGEVADHRLVVRGEPADGRGERSRLGATLLGGQRCVLRDEPAERRLLAMRGEVGLGRLDDPETVRLRLLRRVSPRGDAVTAEDAADRLRVGLLDGRDLQSELEARATPRYPDDLATEGLLRELLAVLRGGEGDTRIRMQVVDVLRVDESVHGGIDRWGGPTLAEQAEVEGPNHLVLTLDAWVYTDKGAHPVKAQHRQTCLGQGAEVPTGSFDPEQLDRLTRDRVGRGALRGSVAARVVRVPRVSAEAVAARNKVGCRAHGSF